MLDTITLLLEEENYILILKRNTRGKEVTSSSKFSLDDNEIKETIGNFKMEK